MDRYAAAALTLIDGDVTIPIRPVPAGADDPIACPSWDIGAPDVRVTSMPRPSSDGTDETGGYLGARTVTLDLLIRGDPDTRTGHDPYWYVNQLTAMAHPARRPVLKLVRKRAEDPTGTAWYMGLRGNPWSVTWERSSAAMLALTLNFTCPSGVLESDLHTVSSARANPDDATDWHFPATFPKGFGPLTGSPFLAITITGSAVNPILYVAGPAKNPKLRDNHGNRFEFNNLTLATGQTVQIDMGAGTVLVADPDTGWTTNSVDVFHTVDFATSTFWQWNPGVHNVDLQGDGSFAVQWRDRQLMI